jgi:hypothetical protein
MTTCFVAQLGRLCIAAADTRLSDDIEGTALDGDKNDLIVTSKGGLQIHVPFKFRKIRRLGRGWGVIAGCFVTGDRMLNLLNREGAASQLHSAEVLAKGTATELAVLESFEGEVGDGLYSSLLLGVTVGDGHDTVWAAELSKEAGYTLSNQGQFAINWPASIPEEVRKLATNEFFASVETSSVEGLVRAAAQLIGAARSAPDSGTIAQVGFTIQLSPTEFESVYIEGDIDTIVLMSDDSIRALAEAIAC